MLFSGMLATRAAKEQIWTTLADGSSVLGNGPNLKAKSSIEISFA